MQVSLMNKDLDSAASAEFSELKNGEWTRQLVSFPTKSLKGEIDEVIFQLPKGGEVLIDDVFLYEDAKK